MDWGLCERLPRSFWELIDIGSYYEKRMFLREKLMYPSVLAYYFAIVIDLVLRFLWVLSLLPPSTLEGFLGHQLSFFLGSVEIFRRSMWGIIRVEYEHLKLLNQRAPGFLGNEVLHKEKFTQSAKTDDAELEGISMKLFSGEKSSAFSASNSGTNANIIFNPLVNADSLNR
jgi:hypothetical protein